MDLAARIQAGAASLSVDLTLSEAKRHLAYLELIAQWNRVTNLTSVRDVSSMISVHLLDSLAIAPYIKGQWLLDVGSGAGLPGIPLAS